RRVRSADSHATSEMGEAREAGRNQSRIVQQTRIAFVEQFLQLLTKCADTVFLTGTRLGGWFAKAAG
ncbi:MAG: hypothetical protein ACXWCY_32685, partial [Burkholderiales bacterium]